MFVEKNIWFNAEMSFYDQERSEPFIPTVISIVAVIVWAIFMLLYTLYWSQDYTFFQNIIVVVLSLVLAASFIGLMWVIWAFRSGIAPSDAANL